jgi:hypothetical protein
MRSTVSAAAADATVSTASRPATSREAGRMTRAGRPGVPLALLALTAVLALGLAGCVPGGQSAPSQSPSTAADPTATPTPTAAPVLVPGGSAADNQPFFDSVNRALVAANPAAGGVEFTSNLRTSGFDIAAMQVTPDITTVGVAADSIQFSVRLGDECLIGQYGQGEYSSVVAPVLGTGSCLIGQTRPIDW